jgi:hypothetical protein
MGPEQSLAELLRVSTQVVDVVVSGPGGVEASSVADGSRADRLGAVGAEARALAGPIRPGSTVTRVEVTLANGSLFVVADRSRVVVATTVPEPAAGLVAQDLAATLARIDPPSAVGVDEGAVG